MVGRLRFTRRPFSYALEPCELVDPTVSFDVAARRLFRHLTDARQLSRNPLVRRFFGGEEPKRFTHAREGAAVSLLRELVVRAAERLGLHAESAGRTFERPKFRRRVKKARPRRFLPRR